jgi:1-acyl-sn-glycerol-3-phosphate acyltransferase
MNLLRSLAFRVAFYLGSVFFVLAAPAYAATGRDSIIRHVRRWAAYHDWCAWHLMGVGYRVEGTLPQGPVLIACKHESMYETIQSLLIFDRPATVMKQELLNIPVWGKAALLYGNIVVDRNAGAKALRAMLTDAKALMAEGRPILIFPEGTRVAPGDAPELKSGIAGLYRMLNLPVVPVACDSGSYLPKKGARRPGTVTFKIGETIPPGLPREEVDARIHSGINALNR